MNKKRSLFLILLSLTFVYSTIAQTDNRIMATWQVVKYDLNVTLPQSENVRDVSISALLQVKNVSQRPATSLTLRISPNAEITSIKIGESVVDGAKSQEKLGSLDLQRVAIRVPSVQPGAVINALVEYKLKVTDNSGVVTFGSSATHFLPLSYWYPTPNSWYFARGADFAPFKVKVNAAPLAVLSAGAESNGAFETKLSGQPFVFAGNWDRIENSGIPVYVPKGVGADAQKRAAELSAIVAEAKAYTATLLGTAPEVPIRIISSRRGAGFSGGGAIVVDEAVFRREKLDSLTVMSVTEAVVKMWLGGSVSLTGDGSGIIREGLSRYIATQFIEEKFGADVAAVERLRQRTAYAAVSRRDSPLNTVAPLDDYYYAAVANKGAMFWRLIERNVGRNDFYSSIRAKMDGGQMTLADLRTAFSAQKDFIDATLDQVTETNLQAGLPQAGNGEVKVAVRNTGPVDVTVNVSAWLANGQKLVSPTTIKAKSFGEIIFKTADKISRIEIDPEKLYPQTDYSDDIAPRETTDSDLLLAVKRDFDRQEFSSAEKTARNVLREYPRFDDVRILLARSLLSLGKIAEAEPEFTAVIDEKLPSARNLAWANVGLADIAARAGKMADALRFADNVIRSDAEYGASLAARNIRSRANAPSSADETVKNYFTQFDRAAISNRKADFEPLVVAGDVNRFVNGISGQATEWKTDVIAVDKLDDVSVLVETNITARVLGREGESGKAVYRLVRSGAGWKLSNVEMFEVR